LKIEGRLSCIGKNDHVQNFYYRGARDPFDERQWHITIYASANYSDGDFFDFKAEDEDSGFLKITMMRHDKSSLYSAKGIAEAMIAEMVCITGKSVRSSSELHPTSPAEFRTKDATRVWDRLKDDLGAATYNRAGDFYVYTGCCPVRNAIDGSPS
jgi:hypothetical protein